MKILGWIPQLILLLCLNSLIFSSNAAQENYQFETDAQRQTFLQLTETLRCPMCQNQNIADSDAMIAHDMRRKVYQLVTEGKTQSEVIDFMKVRYGDFVYYQPPVTRTTIWLWVLPIFVVLLGIVVVLRRQPKTVSAQDEQAALAKAEKLLNDSSNPES